MVIVMVVVRTVRTMAMVLSQLMYLVIPGVLVGFPKQDVVPHSTGLLKFIRLADCLTMIMLREMTISMVILMMDEDDNVDDDQPCTCNQASCAI